MFQWKCSKYFKVLITLMQKTILRLIIKKKTRKISSSKIIGKRFLPNEAKHFFNRVVNDWNSLSSTVVDSITVTSFKNRQDKFLDSNPELNYFSSLHNFFLLKSRAKLLFVTAYFFFISRTVVAAVIV